MEEEKSKMTFNISGGNVQILPNAKEAIQNFNYYGVGDAASNSPEEASSEANTQATSTPDISSRFAIYINNVEIRNRYTTLLKNCQSAAEVGRAVVSMVQETDGFTIDTAKTEPFINILLSLATSVTRGTTVPNFRKAIDNAWFTRKD